AVFGFPPLDAPQLRREEEEEALHAHPGHLRDDEVPALVQHDQRREPRDDQKPGHATARPSIKPRACSRAASSISKSSSKRRTGPPGIASRVRSITSGMPVKGIRLARKASTATSSA